MTFGELKTEVLREAGENPALPRFWTATEAGNAINRAQSVAAWLTLCFEADGTLAHPGGFTAVAPGATFADWILPLRVRVSGLRLMPGSFEQFRAENPLWPSLPSGVARYAMEGWNQMWVYPRPAAAITLEVRRARSPIVMTLDANVPELAGEYHGALVDYAVFALRAKEGASEFAKVLPRLRRFLEAMASLAGQVRRRAIAQNYDVLPSESFVESLENPQWLSTAAK